MVTHIICFHDLFQRFDAMSTIASNEALQRDGACFHSCKNTCGRVARPSWACRSSSKRGSIEFNGHAVV